MPNISRSQEEWRHIIDIQQTSGLTIKQFYVQQNIPEQGFYKAKARLKGLLEKNKPTAVVQNDFITQWH